jgi:hypothetical protein
VVARQPRPQARGGAMTELAGLGPPDPLLLSAVCYCCSSGTCRPQW